MIKPISKKQKNGIETKPSQELILKNPKKNVKNQISGQQNCKRKPSIVNGMEEKRIKTLRRPSTERSVSIRNCLRRQGESIEEGKMKELMKYRRQQIAAVEDKPAECLQLQCNSRQIYKCLQKKEQPSRLRLIRARSNDSLAKLTQQRLLQKQQQLKLKSLRDQNAYLLQVQSQSLRRIESLQREQKHQKERFEGQKRIYEKQIELLRDKINKNKVQIGHLFSFRVFDPVELAIVRPIIEVEQNSSILRSLYATSHQSEPKQVDEHSEYGFGKVKNGTQTTCVKSMQDYKDLSVFY